MEFGILDPSLQPYKFIVDIVEEILDNVGMAIDEYEEKMERLAREGYLRSTKLPVVPYRIFYPQSELQVSQYEIDPYGLRIYFITNTGKLIILNTQSKTVLLEKQVFTVESEPTPPPTDQPKNTKTTAKDKKKKTQRRTKTPEPKSKTPSPQVETKKIIIDPLFSISVASQDQTTASIAISSNASFKILILEWKDDTIHDKSEILEKEPISGIFLSPDCKQLGIAFYSGRLALYTVGNDQIPPVEFSYPLFNIDVNCIPSINKQEYYLRPKMLFQTNQHLLKEIELINKNYKMIDVEPIKKELLKSIVVWWLDKPFIEVYDVPMNEKSKKQWMLPSGISCVAINEQSNLLAAGSIDGTIVLYDLMIGATKLISSVHQTKVCNIAIYSDTHLYSSFIDGMILVYDIRTNEPPKMIKCYQQFKNVQVMGFNDFPYILSTNDSVFDLVENETCKEVITFDLVPCNSAKCIVKIASTFIVLYIEGKGIYIYNLLDALGEVHHEIRVLLEKNESLSTIKNIS